MRFSVAVKVVKSRGRLEADSKREENAGRELRGAIEECSLLATKRREETLSGNSESYAASFVTKECTASMGCDLTILISRQS